jgi:hypothetical protein
MAGANWVTIKQAQEMDSDTLTKIVTSGIMNKDKRLCQESFPNKRDEL